MANQVDVLSCEGQPQGAVELPAALFSGEVSEYALYRTVVMYEGNQRQGTVGVKSRSEVCRTSKKHHRQKGTGWARRGSLRSPLIRGGGVAFGPQARSYRTKMTKPLKRLALRSALVQKVADGAVRVIVDFDFDTPSTKRLQQVLVACGVAQGRVLFVTAGYAPVLHKSCRNLPSVKMTSVENLAAYDLIGADVVVFMRGALARLEDRAVAPGDVDPASAPQDAEQAAAESRSTEE